MALGDVKVLRPGPFGSGPVERFAVASGAAASIKAGEPVIKALGGAAVSALQTNTPVVGTTFMAGIATSTSTDTAAAAGVVDVLKLSPGVVYMCAPLTAATWDTQAEYDALVGDRVLFDLTTGVYTITATDGATNALVVEPLNITLYPGQVAFSLRQAVSYDA